MVKIQTNVRGRGSRGVEKSVVKKDILTGVVKKVPYLGSAGKGFAPLSSLYYSEFQGGVGESLYV